MMFLKHTEAPKPENTNPDTNMKHLRQIIEAFDTSFEYKKRPDLSYGPHHFYAFSDNKDQHYLVHVDHQSGRGIAEVDFSTPDETGKGSNYEATKLSKYGAPKVFSTVGNIMKNHAEEHKITHYTFGASDKEPKRQALYNSIVKKFGGASGEGRKGMREYMVPTGVTRDQ